MSQIETKELLASEKKLATFIEVVVLVGQNYLNCGGPTSRLESRLTEAAHAAGLECEVFAIPTGIFVSASHPDVLLPVTKNARVKSKAFNLHALYRIERLLVSLVKGKVSLEEAKNYLLESRFLKTNYPDWLIAISPLIFGTLVTLPLTKEAPFTALIGGAITMAISQLRSMMVTYIRLNQTFSDFFASWMAFALAALATTLIPTSPEAMVFGSLILMVPGLMLTTAVSELAEHNYVSGVTKLVQGGLTILSMGLAYLLFQEFSSAIGAGKFAISGLTITTGWGLSFWIDVGCLILAVTSFAMTVNVPPKSLAAASAIGLSGIIVLKSFNQSHFFVTSIFASSFAVGFLSLLIGRTFKLPSQVFSVPGIIALVPGLMSLTVFNHFAFAKMELASPLIIQVMLSATAIVFGLLSARIPFTIILRSDDERLSELDDFH